MRRNKADRTEADRTGNEQNAPVRKENGAAHRAAVRPSGAAPAERIASLDLVRTFAILCVVLIHVTRKLYVFEPDRINELSGANRLLSIGCFTIGSIGVPLFLMLTGYLLLAREYDRESAKRFYRTHLFPLLAVWEIWLVIYDLFLTLYMGQEFDAVLMLKRALFLEYAGMEHAWYMPMILGVYLFLPYVSMALHRMDGRVLRALLVILALYRMTVPVVAVWQRATGAADVISSAVDLDYGGSYYGIYLALGFCAAQHRGALETQLRSKRGVLYRLLLLAGALLAGAGCVWMQSRLYSIGYLYLLGYDNVMLGICSACVGLLLLSLRVPGPVTGILQRTSVDAFGVFLVHEFVILVLFRHIGPVTHRYLAVPGITLGTYLLSLAAVELLSLLPYVKRLLWKK